MVKKNRRRQEPQATSTGREPTLEELLGINEPPQEPESEEAKQEQIGASDPVGDFAKLLSQPGEHVDRGTHTSTHFYI